MTSRKDDPISLTGTRRHFLKRCSTGMGIVWLAPGLMPVFGCGTDAAATGPGGAGGTGGEAGSAGTGGTGGMPEPTLVSNIPNLGPVGAADANGLRLPQGFTSRILATSGQAPVASSSYIWHDAPDGGATFAADDGGWAYVSNAEVGGNNGGAGALRFDANGNVVDAYSILSGTNRNCAGGLTPWGTWLSCEETPTGITHECDPWGNNASVALPSLGTFSHEAAAVDLARRQVYLTEDQINGLLYRFTADQETNGRLDLTQGVLEAAAWDEGTGALSWIPVAEPNNASGDGVRSRVPGATAFLGGEGIWIHNDVLFFTTKFDARVWEFDIAANNLSVRYNMATSPMPTLSGVDNVVVSSGGDVIVAEDGGNMELVLVGPDGATSAVVMVEGQAASEITGPAFSPDGSRLYFSSQRGTDGTGITYEVTGPFFVPDTSSSI